MVVKFSENEMSTIINSLDFYSRIWIGQYDNILSDLRWYCNCRQLDEIEDRCKTLLLNIRHHLLPELDSYGFFGSHGIFSPDIDFRAGAAYDMQQVFRYALAYFKHPEGGISVDFNPPMKADLDPYPWPIATCCNEDGIVVEINVCKEQLEIIRTAIEIQKTKFNCEIRNLFSYYTNDENVLKLAGILDNMVEDVEVTHTYIFDIEDAIVKKISQFI